MNSKLISATITMTVPGIPTYKPSKSYLLEQNIFEMFLLNVHDTAQSSICNQVCLDVK